MWIIATRIILFLDLLFIREFDATLLFVNEKKTFCEALKICKEDYGARIATEQVLRRMNLVKQRKDLNKLSKCVPFNTKIWFTEFRNRARQAGKWKLEQEVWWFNRAGLQRQLVRINSHQYFLCYKDGEFSELNDYSKILCNDYLEPVTKSGNSFNPRTTHLVTKEKKSSLTTKWRHHYSRTDRDLFTGRPVSSDSLIGTRNTGGPTSSHTTANTGRYFISRQADLNTAMPTQDNTFVHSTYFNGEISELNDHSTNDDLKPVTNSGNSLNPRTTRLVTKEKKSSETTTWRHYHSRADRNLFTGRLYSSDSLLSSWPSDGPTTSDITTSTGRAFISRQVDLSTAIPAHESSSVDSEHLSTMEIALSILAVLGLIGVILLFVILRLLHNRRKKYAASQVTYANEAPPQSDLDRKAIHTQNSDQIYELAALPQTYENEAPPPRDIDRNTIHTQNSDQIYELAALPQTYENEAPPPRDMDRKTIHTQNSDQIYEVAALPLTYENEAAPPSDVETKTIHTQNSDQIYELAALPLTYENEAPPPRDLDRKTIHTQKRDQIYELAAMPLTYENEAPPPRDLDRKTIHTQNSDQIYELAALPLTYENEAAPPRDVDTKAIHIHNSNEIKKLTNLLHHH